MILNPNYPDYLSNGLEEVWVNRELSGVDTATKSFEEQKIAFDTTRYKTLYIVFLSHGYSSSPTSYLNYMPKIRETKVVVISDETVSLSMSWYVSEQVTRNIKVDNEGVYFYGGRRYNSTIGYGAPDDSLMIPHAIYGSRYV